MSDLKVGESDYGVGEIQVLKGLEPVRKRPGMYIGNLDGTGLRNLIWEVVGNVVDQHLMRNATELHVDVDPDSWVTVRDDGPGISVDVRPPDRKTVLESVLSTLHRSATYDGHFPHVHVSTEKHGVGVAVVTALSTRLEVESTRDGVRWAQAYERGEPVTEVRLLGPSAIDGTSIRFQPDRQFFSTIDFDLAQVRERLQQIAWLNPLLRVFLQGERLPGRGGLRTWVERYTDGTLEALYSTNQSSDGVFVDVAIGWGGSAEPTIRSFVNMHETQSGAHVAGLWRGFSEYAGRLGAAIREPEQVREALGPGLVAILHVGLYDARFGGPTRDHVESPVAGRAVRHILEHGLPTALRRDRRLRAHLERRLGFTWSEPSEITRNVGPDDEDDEVDEVDEVDET